jgi:deoxyadenosine/deoxycytidine kinase
MPIISIDGNIGCGKSTLLEYLHTHYALPIDLEPIKKWQPYLNDMYYHNKGAYEFQVRVWLDRCWIQPKADSTLIMERSPYFQKTVFIPINHDNNRLTSRQVESLLEMYEKSSKLWNPVGYIYLRSNPNKCIERIAHRSRESEEAIDITYIKHLHMLHEINYFKAIVQGYPMICIDIENKTIPDIGQEILHVIEMMGVHLSNGKFQYSSPIIESKIEVSLDTVPQEQSIASKLRNSARAAHYRKKQAIDFEPQQYRILQRDKAPIIVQQPLPPSNKDYIYDTAFSDDEE